MKIKGVLLWWLSFVAEPASFIPIDKIFGKEQYQHNPFPWKRKNIDKVDGRKLLYFITTHDHETIVMRS